MLMDAAGGSGGSGAVAVIPAKGRSVGVARKNLAPVGGVPLVVRAISACRAASRIGLTVVSTEDDEVAKTAEDAGAVVVDRPRLLAGDEASSESVVKHALEVIATQRQWLPRCTLLVQCTSPFLAAADLDRLVELLDSGQADSCFTAAPTHRFLWRQGPGGEACAVNHDAAGRLRRQDRQAEFVETGAAYGFLTQPFLEVGHRFFGRVRLVETDPARAIEIDDPADLDLARAMATTLDAGVTR